VPPPPGAAPAPAPVPGLPKGVDNYDGVILTVGRLVYSSEYLKQNVAVKNSTQSIISYAKVECGFFYKNELIATDNAYVKNIAPQTTGFSTILTHSDSAADRVECRISDIRD